MHESSMINMMDFLKNHHLTKGKKIVDMGSQDLNGSYKTLFGDDNEYIGVDLDAFPNVDIVLGSKEWDDLKDIDAVISTSKQKR